ncbi:MAG TPA: trypsin-like peptidase domain-containing protein [Gemmatimonadales bacterium]
MSVRSLNWLKFGGLVSLAFALGLLFAGLLDLPRSGFAQQAARPAALTPVAAPSIPEARPLAEFSDALAAVADAVVPSVVYIQARRPAQQSQRRAPQGFEEFFGPRNREPRIEQGSGSGFIVSADGYILTNNHVVEGADQVDVRLFDRRQFRARVVGTDPATDVAVLKIDATGLRPAALGDSDAGKIGEWVLAIGNPLSEGLTFTVTSGIISAKGRALRDLQRTNLDIADFIQTDAAINPGNSGGPLVNVRGEVIGINSAIASQTGFYSGYGFAIPINLVRDVMRQLITDGQVHRAAIGVQIAEASRYDAEDVGLSEIRGVLVSALSDDDSPAGKAGIRPGDVIIGVDGKRIDRVGQLQQEIGFRKPGEVVNIEVAREGGERRTFRVALESLSSATPAAEEEAAEDEAAAENVSAPGGATQELLGARVQQVTAALAQQLGLPAGTKGALVTSVTPGGPAWEANLAGPGQGLAFIIQSVDGRSVGSEAELAAALRAVGKGKIATLSVLTVSRNGTTTFVERLRLGGD